MLHHYCFLSLSVSSHHWSFSFFLFSSYLSSVRLVRPYTPLSVLCVSPNVHRPQDNIYLVYVSLPAVFSPSCGRNARRGDTRGTQGRRPLPERGMWHNATPSQCTSDTEGPSCAPSHTRCIACVFCRSPIAGWGRRQRNIPEGNER